MVSKGLELAYVLPDSLSARYEGDPVRVRQILTNLLGNAVKFTERGTIVVRVTVVEEHDGQATLRREVEDAGSACACYADAPINPFTQADGSLTRKYDGTGLGLAIVKRLALLMDVTVGVENTIGQGSELLVHNSAQHLWCGRHTCEAVTAFVSLRVCELTMMKAMRLSIVQEAIAMTIPVKVA